eukprot:227607-Pelagomonas_calceolata.AAC.1
MRGCQQPQIRTSMDGHANDQGTCESLQCQLGKHGWAQQADQDTGVSGYSCPISAVRSGQARMGTASRSGH